MKPQIKCPHRESDSRCFYSVLALILCLIQMFGLVQKHYLLCFYWEVVGGQSRAKKRWSCYWQSSLTLKVWWCSFALQSWLNTTEGMLFPAEWQVSSYTWDLAASSTRGSSCIKTNARDAAIRFTVQHRSGSISLSPPLTAPNEVITFGVLTCLIINLYLFESCRRIYVKCWICYANSFLMKMDFKKLCTLIFVCLFAVSCVMFT